MPTEALSGEQLAAISRELVRITARSYGRGADEAKSYQCDDFVFSVLKGGLTPVERNLLDHGEGTLVRDVRVRFQQLNRDLFQGAIERVTGRRVLTYHSQVLFAPDHVIEMFLLGDEEPALKDGEGDRD